MFSYLLYNVGSFVCSIVVCEFIVIGLWKVNILLKKVTKTITTEICTTVNSWTLVSLTPISRIQWICRRFKPLYLAFYLEIWSSNPIYIHSLKFMWKFLAPQLIYILCHIKAGQEESNQHWTLNHGFLKSKKK